MKNMNNVNYFVMGIVFLLVLFVALYLAAAFTGRETRSYSVLSPDEYIDVAGQSYKVSDFAEHFQPKVHLRTTTPSPDLLWFWYVIVPTDDTYDITYYQVWENEIHPIPAIHRFYAIFRAAYYGYPLYDVEYFQISVERDTGDILGLLFETSPSDDFFVTVSEHIVIRYLRRPDGLFDVIYSTKSGDEVSRETKIAVPLSKNDQIFVLSQTWNHLTRLLSESDGDVEFVDAPLKFLTAEDYSHYKFVRKSQGDHQTEENKWSLGLASLLNMLMILMPGKVVARTISSRKKGGKA